MTPSLNEAQLEFALDLLRFQHTDDSSTVFSPVSIATSLAMVLLGSQGNTAEEIKNALAKALLNRIKEKYAVKVPPSPGPEVDSDDEETREARDERLSDIQYSKASAVLETVNRIYVQNEVNLVPNFVEQMDELCPGGIDKVDFMKADTAGKINDFVAEITREKIKDLVSEDTFNEATRIILINAIYFKGRWGKEFSKCNTKDAPFYSAPGKIKNAKMMKEEVDKYHYSETDKFQMLSLSYQFSKISMKVILPRERYGLEDMIKTLTAAELSKHLTEPEWRDVKVKLPRFEVNTKFDAVKSLKNLGIKDLFGPEANLEGMTESKPMSISSVLHTAFVFTDEEGTEAAAVTAVHLCGCAPPQEPVEFTADHPFLFLITDNKNHIYFCGTVTGAEYPIASQQVKPKTTKSPASKRRKV